MSISLLPDDLRQKEEEEKRKAKNARILPHFKMYVPERQKISPAVQRPVPSDNSAVAKAPPASQPKENFAVPPKPPMPASVIETPKPAPSAFYRVEQKPIPPPPFKKEPLPAEKVEAKPILKESSFVTLPKPIFVEPGATRKDGQLHYPTETKYGENIEGKKVVRESDDKFSDIAKPDSLSRYLKTDKKVELEPQKKPPEVNLINKNYAEAVKREFWSRAKALAGLLVILVVLVSIGFLGIKFYANCQVKKYNDLGMTLAIAQEEINNFQSSAIQVFKLKERAAALEGLLGKHLYWTKFFDFLEHTTAPAVSYVDLAVSDDGQAILTAKAKSYGDVATQLFLFQNSEFIASVDINAMNQVVMPVNGEDSKEINFNVRLKLKDNSLLK